MRNGRFGAGAGGLLLLFALVLAPVGPAFATTDLLYGYDVLGRLVVVTYPDGTIISYGYDAAGNRKTKASGVFVATIQVTGTAPVNLRDLANTAGYTGVQPATITFEVGSGVTLTGEAAGGAAAIDTGTWPSGVPLNLTLLIKSGGAVHGGGGTGGAGGGTAAETGFPGTGGGDAVNVQQAISITVQSGAAILSGGDGGAGGVGADRWDPGTGQDYSYGGGGGGGGFPDGPGGAGGTAPSGYVTGIDGNPGSAGTTSGGGAPGAGFYDPGAGTTGPGIVGNGAGDGYAIRKNGHTVTVGGSGTVVGPVG